MNTPPKEPLPPLPPIYPVPVIEVACRALESLSGLTMSPADDVLADDLSVLDVQKLRMCALRIIRDGLASHETMIKEGRSRG